MALKKDPNKPDFTRLLKQEVKKYNITEREKCFADLMAAGWKDKDAFLMSGLYNLVYSKETNEREMNKLMMEDIEFRAYWSLARKRAARGGNKEKSTDPDAPQEFDPDNIDMSSELSKESQLRDLLIAKKKAVIGSTEWLKIVQTIADITQAKKDEIMTEDNTIHYYLPLTCNMCELYKRHKRKSGIVE